MSFTDTTAPTRPRWQTLIRLAAVWLSLMTAVISMPTLALSPAEAAEKARASTGGRVLKVKQADQNRYRVKVLMPNGQVRNLSVGNGAQGKKPKKK